MQRFLFISILTFLVVFAFGGGLLIVSRNVPSEPDLPPIQIVE
jgi:hypothetical protein